ncbi:MAG: ankyrin repeat domain-containing protein [Gammaproteobacteria bacterium]|nr:ankyrin repeat domain-containing protein [Gammaproteobacteria bacterium]
MHSPTLDATQPLFYAATTGHHHDLIALLNENADASMTNIHLDTPLHRAAANGQLKCVQILADHPSSHIDAQNIFGNTPLHEAALSAYTKIIGVLIKKSASVNKRNKSNSTPLICAALNGHKESLEALLEAGADPNVVNYFGLSALDCALYSGSLHAVYLLLQHDAIIRDTSSLQTFLSKQNPSDPKVVFCLDALKKQEAELTEKNVVPMRDRLFKPRERPSQITRYETETSSTLGFAKQFYLNE